MKWSEKTSAVDRGYPEDEENLHWPEEEPTLEDEDDDLNAGDDDWEPADDDRDADEVEISWAIRQEEKDDWG
jgi:hypothetical protein